MRVSSILKQYSKGTMRIETLTSRSFLGIKLKPIKRTFTANKEVSKGEWNWVETDNKNQLSEYLKRQLNEWLQYEI